MQTPTYLLVDSTNVGLLHFQCIHTGTYVIAICYLHQLLYPQMGTKIHNIIMYYVIKYIVMVFR